MSRQFVNLDITTARLFVATVESGSIAYAAKAEAIAASALSKRIQVLETDAGTPLLVRHRRGVEVTSAGMIVLRRARAILHEARQLRVDLDAAIGGMTGRVHIVGNETALMNFVPLALPDFVFEHPGVEIAMEERSNSAVVRAIWQNAADIGIYVGDVPPLDLWRCPIFRDRLVLVLFEGHPLIEKKTPITMIDILDHEIIGQAPEGVLWSLLTRAAAAHKRVLKAQLFADGYDAVCSIVSRKLGIGIISESAAKVLAPRMDLIVMPIVDAWASREHHICVRSIEALGPAQRAVLNHLIQKSDLASL